MQTNMNWKRETVLVSEKKARASRWRAIAYPAPAPSHTSELIKIPNAFLQSSSIGLLAQKAWEELCDNKKKGPKILHFDLCWPPDIPRVKRFAPLFITFDLIYIWLCLYKMDFGPFRTIPPLALPPGGPMCSSSTNLLGYRLWKFRDSSLNGLGAMVWDYRRTDGRTGIS